MEEKRPKSSIIGIADLGLTAYNSKNIHAIKSDIQTFNDRFEVQVHETRLASTAIDQLQRSTSTGLAAITRGLHSLENQMYNLEDRLEELLERGDNTGDLRLLIVLIEEEISRIRHLHTTYPEYAAYMARKVSEKSSELSITNLKYMSVDEIKWSKRVIEDSLKLRDELVENQQLSNMFEEFHRNLNDIVDMNDQKASCLTEMDKLAIEITNLYESFQQELNEEFAPRTHVSIESFDEFNRRLKQLRMEKNDIKETLSSVKSHWVDGDDYDLFHLKLNKIYWKRWRRFIVTTAVMGFMLMNFNVEAGAFGVSLSIVAFLLALSLDGGPPQGITWSWLTKEWEDKRRKRIESYKTGRLHLPKDQNLAQEYEEILNRIIEAEHTEEKKGSRLIKVNSQVQIFERYHPKLKKRYDEISEIGARTHQLSEGVLHKERENAELLPKLTDYLPIL